MCFASSHGPSNLGPSQRFVHRELTVRVRQRHERRHKEITIRLKEDTIGLASRERPRTKKGGSMTEASESSTSPRGAEAQERRSTESQRRNGARQHQLGDRFGNVSVLLVVS